ncbi:MAG: Protein MpaA [Phycisphaerae bacterium]|nr:Protein MpaA [Phycisphaerae bacterium]
MLKTHVLGTSVHGAPIHVYELVKPAPVIMILAGIHGDEPQSAYVGDCVVELLRTAVGNMMDEHLVVVPHLNPDGLVKKTRQNGHGVDLNRNFPSANWKQLPPDDPYFGGPMAGSEPETQLVLDLFRRYQPRRILTIHCIDQQRYCVNYDGPAENLARIMARENNYPVNADIGHPTPGSLGTWAGYERKIPTITLELPADQPEESCWQDNRDAILNFIQAEL